VIPAVAALADISVAHATRNLAPRFGAVLENQEAEKNVFVRAEARTRDLPMTGAAALHFAR
jgi:hypothetical protein